MKIKISALLLLIITVYVLSEGGFNNATSSLSMWNSNSNEFTQSIFNPGNIGLFPDGLIQHGEYLYLTEQGSFGGSGKIYKLEMDGTVVNSREIGTNPYSLTISNEKIYLTNAPAGNVSIINLSDFSDVKTVSVGAYPQEITSFEGKVFVANNSLYGGAADSTVSVIDSETDEVIHTIKGRRDPFAFSSISLAISNDDHLLFACPGSASTAMIYKVELSTFEKVDSMIIEGYGFDRDIVADKNSNKIFFKSSTNEIIGYDLIEKNAQVIISDNNLISINGYAYDHVSGMHCIVDAKDFVAKGSISFFDSSGNLLNSYETSIAPRRILLEYIDNAVSVEDDIITSEFRLEQNYPNPFNPSTTIKYRIPINEKSETLNTKMIVFDILGREVKKLVDEIQKPGSYEIEFDGSQLTNGIYFYRLQVYPAESGAGDPATSSGQRFVETKKMILLK